MSRLSKDHRPIPGARIRERVSAARENLLSPMAREFADLAECIADGIDTEPMDGEWEILAIAESVADAITIAWFGDDENAPPYGLAELDAAADRVFIVETDSAVDSLQARGFAAVCNRDGAGRWRREYSKELRGRRVFIIFDPDEPSRPHALQIARSLHGVAAEIRIVKFDGAEVSL